MGNGVTAWIGGHRRWIWLVAGIVVLALLVTGVVRALTAGATEKPKATATVAVDRGAVSTEVATTGTLQPAQSRSLSFTVSSTVTSVAVRAGTEVTAGQDLAKVDNTDATAALATAQDSLTQAETALTTAEASAANATSSSNSTSSCTGANVPAAYTSPSASASASPSGSASPSPSTTRTATPRPTRTTPAPTHATTGAPRGGAPATSCAAGGSGSSGGSTGGGSQQSSGDAVLSAQQRVTQANVTLQNAEDALAGATITAPIAGRILTVAGKVGTQVSSGSTFITLADVYNMQISANFPEADADRLAIRQKAVITLADQPGKTFNATVVQVDPTGTSDGTMVRYGVVLSFTDPPKDLLVGQSASVRVTTGSAADVLRVPSSALHGVAGGTATVLKSAGGVTSQAQVTIGLRGDQYTEVKSGLAAGDTVVRSW
jgi:HlyD family secretion protein